MWRHHRQSSRQSTMNRSELVKPVSMPVFLEDYLLIADANCAGQIEQASKKLKLKHKPQKKTNKPSETYLDKNKNHLMTGQNGGCPKPFIVVGIKWSSLSVGT